MAATSLEVIACMHVVLADKIRHSLDQSKPAAALDIYLILVCSVKDGIPLAGSWSRHDGLSSSHEALGHTSCTRRSEC